MYAMQTVNHDQTTEMSEENQQPTSTNKFVKGLLTTPRVLYLRERVLAEIKKCVPLKDASCSRNELLMHVIEHGTLEEVKHVLDKNASGLINVPCSALMITALHMAASKGEYGLDMVKHLLQHGAKPELADKLGRTALHYAAASGCQELVEVLISAGAPVNSRFQVKQLEYSFGAVVARLKEKALVESIDETDSSPASVSKRRVRECLGITAGKKLPLPECFGRTPLHQAVKGGFISVVRSLIAAGADVNVQDDSGLSPLLLAGAGVGADARSEEIDAYEEIVQVLVAAGAKVDHRNKDTGATPLNHAAARRSVKAVRCLLDAGADVINSILLSGESVLHVAARAGCIIIVNLLLERGAGQHINLQDKVGQTPLHLAAYSGAREVLHLLIRKGGDISIVTLSNVSVMNSIFSHIPRPINFFTEALDRCIVPNAASVNDRTFAVKLDFRLLAPRGLSHQMAVISSLMAGASYYQQMNIFEHPVLETYLRLKWRKLRIFFSFLLGVHLIFVTSLSVYVYLLVKPCNNAYSYHDISRRVLFASACIILFHSVAQIVMLPKHYIRQYETWISLSCALLCLVVAIAGEYHASEHSKLNICVTTGLNATGLNATWLNATGLNATWLNATGLNATWLSATRLNATRLNATRLIATGLNATSLNTTWLNVTEINPSDCCLTTIMNDMKAANQHWVLHVLSIAVLLAWAELMLLIGRFPTWGLYALMFYTVLRNVFKVLLTFVCLVVGFAFSFMIQYPNAEVGFSDPWVSFVKTTVMMMGEFEYNDTFSDTNDRLTPTSRLIFLAFVLLTSIVLMNLMVGLAVSDIQALEKESHIRRGLKQADFVAHLEKFTSHTATVYMPRCLVRFFEDRRSVDIVLRLQPSVNATWKKYVSYELMESIVAVAIMNQTRTGVQDRKQPTSSTRVYHEDGHRNPPSEDQITIIALLQSLQREVGDLRDMLALDKNTASVARTFSEAPYENKAPERKARPTAVRFSDVAGVGLRVHGFGHHNDMLKSLRRKMDRNNVV